MIPTSGTYPDDGLPFAGRQWRVARSLVTLYQQIIAAFPDKDTSIDAAVGDDRHRQQGSSSDHNAWVTVDGIGVVTALDVTNDPPYFDTGPFTDEMQQTRDPRIKYVIANGWIMSGPDGPSPWVWRTYGGSNPHTSHVHISVQEDPALFDDASEWGMPSLNSGGAVTRYWPSHGGITSGFGPRGDGFHDGIDLGAACGTPIWAAERGTVIAAGPASGYGNWIRIDHGGGTVTEYGHMFSQDLLVSVGQWVGDGQQIARVGTAGTSTGCHLHFEVQINGTSIDPVPWLADAVHAEDHDNVGEEEVAQIDLDRIAQIFWENFQSWDPNVRPGWPSFANGEGEDYHDLPMGYDRWTDLHLTELINTGREQDGLIADAAAAVAAREGVDVEELLTDINAAFDEVSAELPIDVRVNITGLSEPNPA